MKLKIAEHRFTVSIDSKYDNMLGAYLPFVCNDDMDELFSVEVVDNIDYDVVRDIIVDADRAIEGSVRVDIFETTEGILYKIIMPGSSVVDCQLHIAGGRATIAIGQDSQNMFYQSAAFTNAMILSYLTFTLPLNTLLMHASAVMKDGFAYLFIGKSGTGKSTHTRMWRESFADAELLNDDHPVVRYYDDGSVVAYGSPWSGKTPCYRNLSAPLGAIVRIVRADFNALTRLTPIRAYASVMTSTTAAQWSSELSAAKVAALDRVITTVACYQMECLPNNDAARSCYESLCAER